MKVNKNKLIVTLCALVAAASLVPTSLRAQPSEVPQLNVRRTANGGILLFDRRAVGYEIQYSPNVRTPFAHYGDADRIQQGDRFAPIHPDHLCGRFRLVWPDPASPEISAVYTLHTPQPLISDYPVPGFTKRDKTSWNVWVDQRAECFRIETANETGDWTPISTYFGEGDRTAWFPRSSLGKYIRFTTKEGCISRPFFSLINHPVAPSFHLKRGLGGAYVLGVTRLAEGWTVQVSVDRGVTWHDYWTIREGQKNVETDIVSGARFRLVRND